MNTSSASSSSSSAVITHHQQQQQLPPSAVSPTQQQHQQHIQQQPFSSPSGEIGGITAANNSASPEDTTTSYERPKPHQRDQASNGADGDGSLPAESPAVMVRETVFSSQVYEKASPKKRSYETDIDQACGMTGLSPTSSGSTPPGNNTSNAASNCDVNVTYDLIEGLPSVPEGLSVRDSIAEEIPPMPPGPIVPTPHMTGVDDLLAQTPPIPPSYVDDELDGGGNIIMNPVLSESLDNLRLGAEAQDNVSVTSSNQSAESSRVIGGIAIAEYEGSPRRIRPRTSDQQPRSSAAHLSKSKSKKSGSAHHSVANSRLPGFPQRVLPPSSSSSAVAANAAPGLNTSSPTASARHLGSSASSTASSSNSSFKAKLNAGNSHPVVPEQQQNQKPQEQVQQDPSDVLLKFDEITKNEELLDQQKQQSAAAAPVLPGKTSSGAVYDYQYEFSETRKVLDEFFNKTPEEASGSAGSKSQTGATAKPEADFADLNYTLKRRTPQGEEGSPTSCTSNSLAYVGQRLAASTSAGNAADNQDSGSIVPEAAGRHPQDQQQQQLQTQGDLLQLGNGLAVRGRHIVANSFSQQQQLHQQQQLPQQPDTGYATLNSPESAVRNHQHASQAAVASVAPGRTSLVLQGSNAASGQHGPGENNPDCSRNFTLSPETTDCDSADLESEVSMNEGSFHSSGPRMHTAMPVLEDGLSSGHASDLEDDVIYSR